MPEAASPAGVFGLSQRVGTVKPGPLGHPHGAGQIRGPQNFLRAPLDCPPSAGTSTSSPPTAAGSTRRNGSLPRSRSNKSAGTVFAESTSSVTASQLPSKSTTRTPSPSAGAASAALILGKFKSYANHFTGNTRETIPPSKSSLKWS
jgi:hypothetical protein